jgi:hypothetical protein
MVKQIYRSAGRKPTSIRYRELCEDADRYLNDHRDEMMAWAQKAVTEIKTSRTKSKR